MDDGWNQPELQAKGPGQILVGHQDMTSAVAWSYSVGLGRSSATVECRGRAPVRGFGGGRTLSVLGSRVWPFWVVWRHRSRDHFFTPYAISYWWSFGSKPLFLTVFEIFNVECTAMVDMTLIRPLNKGQGHLLRYQSISHIRLPIGCQYGRLKVSRIWDTAIWQPYEWPASMPVLQASVVVL